MLKDQVKDWYVQKWFSTGKDELILELRSAAGLKQIQFTFFEGELFVLWNQPWRNAGNRCIPWFIQTENEQLTDVLAIKNERALYLQLSNGHNLLLKGFGMFGNVLWYEQQKLKQHFRQHLKADANLDLDIAAAAKIWIHHAARSYNDVPKPIKTVIETLKIENLEPFWQLSSVQQNEQIDKWIADMQKYSLIWQTNTWGYTQQTADLLEQIENYLKQARKKELLTKAKQQLIKQRTQKQKLLADYLKQEANYQTPRNYKMQADLLLIHMPSISDTTNTVHLVDVVTGQEIKIKVNPKLNAQQNAEKYYKKAKNEHLELQQLVLKRQNTELELAEIETQLNQLLSGVLPHVKQANKPEYKQQSKPYKQVWIDEIEVWIGKSAAQNDQMIKQAHKQDCWLHVRGVAGSHVIIRNRGKKISSTLLQQAAKLAVQNSKAKTQSLVAVIYTELKYVSKPKNAAPGEVRILKENVIDVQND